MEAEDAIKNESVALEGFTKARGFVECILTLEGLDDEVRDLGCFSTATYLLSLRCAMQLSKL